MQVKLYEIRKNQKGMSQAAVAEHLGISVNTYREKELSRSEFTLDEMFKLSYLFQMPMEEIFLPRDTPER